MVTFSQAQASAYLQTVLSQSLNQDAFAYFDIEKPPLIKALYEYLCLNQGGLLNLTSLAGELGASAKTVAAYMDVLELMGLTYLIYNSTHPLIKLNSSRKAYVSSMFALLNSKFDWPNALGLAAEAYVLERLLERGETVTFFRQRTQEIDFLLPKKKLAYEVKYRPDPGPIPATLPDYHIEIISLDQALPVCLF
jgi:predicted AAA+ superfamily ATPase